MTRDKFFKLSLKLAGGLIALLVFSIFVSLIISSIPSIKEFGLSFVFGKEWNPVEEHFSALPFIFGTLLTSIIALAISLPFSLAIAFFLGEFSKKGFLSSLIAYATDLLAGVPSVIYGFWGLYFLIPLIRKLEMHYGIPPYGVGILTASIVLSIMIIPYASSIAREVISLVPSDLKEAGYALGSTRFEVIKKVVFPYSMSGIFAGVLLSFGRAVGETMAVTMVIGNANRIPKSIFEPANTLASVIANEFTEATSDIHLSSLIYLGLILFIITFFINYIGNIVIERMSVNGRN